MFDGFRDRDRSATPRLSIERKPGNLVIECRRRRFRSLSPMTEPTLPMSSAQQSMFFDS